MYTLRGQGKGVVTNGKRSTLGEILAIKRSSVGGYCRRRG